MRDRPLRRPTLAGLAVALAAGALLWAGLGGAANAQQGNPGRPRPRHRAGAGGEAGRHGDAHGGGARRDGRGAHRHGHAAHRHPHRDGDLGQYPADADGHGDPRAGGAGRAARLGLRRREPRAHRPAGPPGRREPVRQARGAGRTRARSERAGPRDRVTAQRAGGRRLPAPSSQTAWRRACHTHPAPSRGVTRGRVPGGGGGGAGGHRRRSQPGPAGGAGAQARPRPARDPPRTRAQPGRARLVDGRGRRQGPPGRRREPPPPPASMNGA